MGAGLGERRLVVGSRREAGLAGGRLAARALHVVLFAFVTSALAGACDDDTPPPPAPGAATAASGSGAATETPLLSQAGALGASSPSDARGHYDRYFLDVAANDRLVVTLSSSTFDPSLEVTPPGSGALVNDDWQGDRTRSRIELIAASAGQLKVEVRSYGADGSGAYQLEVRRAAQDAGPSPAGGQAPNAAAGQPIEGELAAGDHALSSGEVFDSYALRIEGRARVSITGIGGPAPRATVIAPDGRAIEPSQGGFDTTSAGEHRLQVIGALGQRYRVSVTGSAWSTALVLARGHHRFDAPTGPNGTAGAGGVAGGPPPTPLPVRVGDRLSGNLSETDAVLPSGERYDLYELVIAAPQEQASIELESAAFDTFVRVEGPNGERWENDDSGGTLNSRVEVPLTQAGTYRIVATSYRAGSTGLYELKVLGSRDGASGTGGAPAVAVTEQTFPGQLRRGDTTLQSGEYYDEQRFTWALGARVHLEARSEDFDTYLIVRPPTGPQRDNDDMVPGQSLNAGLDLQVDQPGEWRVLVTSYRPHTTGDYTLVVSGAPPADSSAPSENVAGGQPPSGVPAPSAPAPAAPAQPVAGGRTERGTLAQGDSALQSGEFSDSYTMTFTPGSAARIRLESSEFDPYLIVSSPSGHQEDNDDLDSGSLNSGIDIPVVEPGEYRILVTSYRPGETGSYTLTVSEGPSVVAPPSVAGTNGSGTPGSGGGRVWGLFAGITDYPGSENDLPECANDARKLAEALRNQGSMPSDQEFLFTDAQATTANIRQAMQSIASRVRPDDVVVFFFSGHGGQTSSSQDTRELDGRDEYLVAYDGDFSDDELGQLFDRVNARVALVAIDACFAGGFSKDIITRPGRVGMFSSEEDVTSGVADDFQAGGYLSHFLRLGIQGEADNDPRNAILTVGELTHYTWVQFGQHASDVRMSMGYQHLVVDRGAVRTTEVLWANRR